MNAFFLSFGVIFLAELGDKSQLMAMTFATRYRALTVLVAVTLATLLVHAGSVLVGSLFALALPTSLIQVVAGVAFFVFAAWTIRGDELGEGDEARAKRGGRWALLTIGTAFFLAELGDKTMLATITLATTRSRSGSGWARRPAWSRQTPSRSGSAPSWERASRSARSRSSPRSRSSCSGSCSWPRAWAPSDLPRGAWLS